MEGGAEGCQVSRSKCVHLVLILLVLRSSLKEAHNVRFGSVFRTEKSPTYFSRRLASFSNLYTSSLDNLLHYPLNHTFIPRRAALPHEPDLNFDL